MPVTDIEWSASEKKIARAAFERAYEREIEALMAEVKARAVDLSDIEDLWRLHDYLSARRHEIDGKYDYRYTMLLFVFSQLVREGWLQIDELQGLEASKRSKVAALARM
ncbi:hypothetical protein GS597_00935 [Synechococcales cyanobacterium C]|uniref:Fluorescence recovery protein n=1 Tax=Petrachloros mirabilis ULC683 TaxID=2781853 RepID=A0A8K2AGR4_9CYAN|nr:hypothetical protein [Petrachloros mirabilis]NCJ05104.1 hypothetical protein [Petrachloros mirabilis ULC683]